MTRFQPFGMVHWATLAVIGIIAWMFAWANRPRADSGPPAALERALGHFNLFVWFFAHTYWLLPGQFDVAKTLPLQLCHIASLAASAALLTGRREYQTLVYYWGLALSHQALITLSLDEGPAILWFWVFWQQHGILVVVAVHALVARGYRPHWRDFAFACAATAGYFCVVFPLDALLGLNYGFVGPTRPDQATIIDLLGPWPWRVPAVMLLAAGAMLLATLPWIVLDRVRRRIAVR